VSAPAARTGATTRPARRTRAATGSVLLVLLTAWSSHAADVLVGRNDVRGTGANLAETLLTTANVTPATFGKLFSYEVDGFVYAQPLLVSELSVGGRIRNVLYVATTSSMVYALDADRPGIDGGLLWQARLTERGELPNPSDDQTARTVRGRVGILSTPVIDRGRGALYVVSRSLGPAGHVQRLHALDLATGREKPPGPVDLCRPECASWSKDGLTFSFDPKVHSNRPGLTLSGSSIVIAWGGLDSDHGWVLAYDADTLERTGVFCTTCAKADRPACPCPTCTDARVPSLLGGGIWQSGRPPAVDAGGNVYYFVGNGWTMGHFGGHDGQGHERDPYVIACCPGQAKPPGYYGQSLVKLAPRTLTLEGSWTPAEWCSLEHHDDDLGGSGPVLVDFRFSDGDTRTFAVGGGKEGRLYAIDTSRMKRDLVEGPAGGALRGDFLVADTPSPCLRRRPGTPHHIMAGPVVWPRSMDGKPSVFVSVENDCVRGFALASRSTLSATMTPVVNRTAPTATAAVVPGHPGAILSLSANGDRPGSGILWMTHALDNPADTGATFATRRGRVAAFDADDLRRELWNSDLAGGGRDHLGHFAKFTPPTIANGKVYVASFPGPEPYKPIAESYHGWDVVGSVVVYGLSPPARAPVRSFTSELLPAILPPLLAR
jgi:outer membrane protein assembly factor BamB